jgi:O-antigen ligase
LKTGVAFFVAVLAAAGILAAQVAYGGLLYPVLAVPGMGLLGLAAVVAVVLVPGRGRHVPWAVPVVLGACFAGWMLWRAALGAPCAETDGWVRLILACAVIYFLFAGVVTRPDARFAFLGIIFLAGLVQAFLGAWQFLRNPTDMPIPWLSEQLRLWYGTGMAGNKRAHGFFINGIHLAWLLNIVSLGALAAGCWARWPVWARVLAIYVAAVGFAVMLATLSRGGVVGMLAGLGVFLLACAVAFVRGGRGGRLVVGVTVAAGVAVTVGSAWMVFSGSFLVQDRVAVLLDDTYRPMVAQATIRQFQLDPLFGGGPGSFKVMSRAYREFASPTDDTFAHNDWAQTASDFGYPAFALLLLLVVALFASGFRGLGAASARAGPHGASSSNGVAVHIACLAGLAAGASHALFDFSMQIPANALLTCALAGMLANPGLPPTDRAHPVRAAAGFLAAFAAVVGGGVLLVLLALQGPREFAYLRAENALLTGDADRALALATARLERNPSSFDFRVLRARALMQATPSRLSRVARDALSAAADIYSAAALRPLDPFQEIDLGMVEGRAGRFDAALGAGTRAIALFPTYAGGYEVAGMALEAMNRTPDAIHVYATGAHMPNAQRLRDRLKILRDKNKPPQKTGP